MRWPWQSRRRHAKNRVVFIGGSPWDDDRVTPAQPEPAVQLGFADGSVLALADDDPRAVALRAAAARLTTKD
jgi:hypothetical protein